MTPEVRAKVDEWVHERFMEKAAEKDRAEGRAEVAGTLAIEFARAKLADAFTEADEQRVRAGRDVAALMALCTALAGSATAADARAVLVGYFAAGATAAGAPGS